MAIGFYSQHYMSHVTRIKRYSHTVFIQDMTVGFYPQHFMSHVTRIRKRFSHVIHPRYDNLFSLSTPRITIDVTYMMFTLNGVSL